MSSIIRLPIEQYALRTLPLSNIIVTVIMLIFGINIGIVCGNCMFLTKGYHVVSSPPTQIETLITTMELGASRSIRRGRPRV